MNLKSYVRLNPYFDDEKHGRGEDEGQSRTALAGSMVLLAMAVLGSWLLWNWFRP
ncbi:hypothetical protein L209DRAFT_750094 [Thermothelomyces heterothallicus CBS 203.75]